MKKKEKMVIFVSLIITAILIYVISNNTIMVTKNEVKKIILKDINKRKSSVTFDTIALKEEDGLEYYDVIIVVSKLEYEYKINLKDGTIISSNYQYDNNLSTTSLNILTENEIKEIILKHLKIEESDIRHFNVKKTYNDGKKYYEVEVWDSKYEYKYDLSITGKIINFDKKRVRFI